MLRKTTTSLCLDCVPDSSGCLRHNRISSSRSNIVCWAISPDLSNTTANILPEFASISMHNLKTIYNLHLSLCHLDILPYRFSNHCTKITLLRVCSVQTEVFFVSMGNCVSSSTSPLLYMECLRGQSVVPSCFLGICASPPTPYVATTLEERQALKPAFKLCYFIITWCTAAQNIFFHELTLWKKGL